MARPVTCSTRKLTTTSDGMRAPLTLAIALCVLLAAGGRTTESGPATVRAKSALTIELRSSKLELRGAVSSVAHEAILRQTALKLFAGRKLIVKLREQPALPPGWALITEVALRSLAETRSATVNITDDEIRVRGITSNRDSWNDAASRIRRSLLPGMTLRQNMEEIKTAGSMNRQCIELFRTALRGRKIEFAASSAELRTSTAPLLDELIQITVDCPGAGIRVTGHTDNTGNEAGNRALSQARADAIAAYLVAGGLLKSRITATGAGSSRPLVEETGTRARQLNRRIDIDIEFP